MGADPSENRDSGHHQQLSTETNVKGENAIPVTRTFVILLKFTLRCRVESLFSCQQLDRQINLQRYIKRQ